MANKYLVFGHTAVTVVVEVIADSEAEAYRKANDELPGLTAYVGNGDTDKLVGVDGENQSVNADGEIEYDYIELIDQVEDDADDYEDDDDGEDVYGDE